jgi:FKBP-type peptidyl-prolyl cis-trans isomerase SlyD
MTTHTLQFIKQPGYARVRKDRVVRLRYAVLDVEREAALAYSDDLYYLHGGYGGAFPKVEQALEGFAVGMRCELVLEPEDAYGPRQPELTFTAPAAEIPEAARQVGARLQGEAADGSTVEFVVTAIGVDEVTLDANHPWAGRRLRFVLEVLEVRAATPAELAAGYAFRDPGAAAPA